MFEIVQTETHGKVIIANESMNPGIDGLEIFVEEAIFVAPTFGTPQDQSGRAPNVLKGFDPQMWVDWWKFQQYPKSVQQTILNDMYQELDCAHAIWLVDYLDQKCRDRQDYFAAMMNNGQESKHHDEAAAAATAEEEKQQEESKHDDSTFNNHLESYVRDELDDSILDNMEDFVRLSMVIRFNSVELIPPSDDGTGPGHDYGHGLFAKACKMSHSCKPNCVWHTGQDGKTKIVRAIAPIAKGEELTIDYIGNKLDPVHLRREILQQSKGFTCNCSRCLNSMGDDTRRFPCCSSFSAYYTDEIDNNNESKTSSSSSSLSSLHYSSCPGVHFLCQPLSSAQPELLNCTICGQVPSQEYVKSVLTKEVDIVHEIEELDHIAENQLPIDVRDRIRNLHPPHRLHCLAEKCYQIQGELFSQIGDYDTAAKAYAKVVDCRVEILGQDYYNESTAFAIEKLGDCLQYVDLQQAEQAYRRVVRILQMMRGGTDDPYSKCAITKLLTVQRLQLERQQGQELQNDSFKNTAMTSRRNEDPKQEEKTESNVATISSQLPPPPRPFPSKQTSRSLSSSSSSCLFCGNKATIQCHCCDDVNIKYCCTEHMHVHWNLVHKQECSKKKDITKPTTSSSNVIPEYDYICRSTQQLSI